MTAFTKKIFYVNANGCNNKNVCRNEIMTIFNDKAKCYSMMRADLVRAIVVKIANQVALYAFQLISGKRYSSR